MKIRHLGFLAIAALQCFSLQINAAQAASAPAPAFDVRKVIASTQAVPPEGIDELKAVDVGGIKQWLSIKGTDKKNPILLFVHGGPGDPMMAESWTFQRPWEDYFTVVQWDQRGSGKTFSSSHRKSDKPLTLDLMTSDAIEVIEYLRETYGKRKIFLLGHSWGSIIGLEVARRHPELLYAYIGISQVVDVVQGESAGYKLTLAEAQRQGNVQAVSELRSIAPYPGADGSISIEKTMVERKWARDIRGISYTQKSQDDARVRSLSPEYSSYDIKSASLGEEYSAVSLWAGLSKISFSSLHAVDCPIIIFSGNHDTVTPGSLSREFFDNVKAPFKRYYAIEKASHNLIDDAPGTTLVNLVNDVLPLASTDAVN